MSETKKPEKKSGLLSTIGSVLAAGFGVQSSRNHERDFAQGKARNFIIGGLIFTVLFVLTVYFVVSTVLGGAGH